MSKNNTLFNLIAIVLLLLLIPSTLFLVALIFHIILQLAPLINHVKPLQNETVVRFLEIYLFAILIIIITILIVRYTWWAISLHIKRQEINKLAVINKVYSDLVKSHKRLSEHIKTIIQYSQRYDDKISEIEIKIIKTENRITSLRYKINESLKKFEKDVNKFINFVLQQFKNYIPELITLFQIALTSYILEYDTDNFLPKYLSNSISLFIFVILIAWKSERISRSFALISYTMIEIAIIATGLHFDVLFNIPKFIYYLISIFIYVLLIRRILIDSGQKAEKVSVDSV